MIGVDIKWGVFIKDFVGTVLHWSGAIEVFDYEEYVEFIGMINTDKE